MKYKNETPCHYCLMQLKNRQEEKLTAVSILQTAVQSSASGGGLQYLNVPFCQWTNCYIV